MVRKLLIETDCIKIGKVLNERTNRCNKIKYVRKILTTEDCLKIGKFLNTRTNRCNKKNPVNYSTITNNKRTPYNSSVNSTIPITPMKIFSSSSHQSKKTISPIKKVSSRPPVLEKSASRKKMSSSVKMSSSRKRRVDEFVKKRAAKIIQKLTMPFINRVSVNIDDRIKLTRCIIHIFLN